MSLGLSPYHPIIFVECNHVGITVEVVILIAEEVFVGVCLALKIKICKLAAPKKHDNRESIILTLHE